MRTFLFAIALCTLAATGCDAVLSPPPKGTVVKATSQAATTTPVQPRNASSTTKAPVDAPPANPNTPNQVEPRDREDPEEYNKKPEELPDFPKADAKSVVKELNKEKTLFLETLPDGRKRLHLIAEVCLRHGLLEVLLTRKNTKEHESILRTDIDARFLHTALVAMGAKPGTPVQYVNPTTELAEYKPASGHLIKVSVCYNREGKLQQHDAQDWIIDRNTKKPMAHNWVFAGSRLVRDPDRPEAPPYYTANNGEIIAISNFADSMLDLPVKISREADELNFDCATKLIPPLRSRVWVTLEPQEEKKK